MKASSSKDHLQRDLTEKAEWDFSECPDEEAEACNRYEYARECPDIVAAIAYHGHRFPTDKNGNVLPGNLPPPKPKRVDAEFRTLCLDLSWLCFVGDAFPSRPWLTIPHTRRKLILATNDYKWRSRDPWTVIQLERGSRVKQLRSKLCLTVDHLTWKEGKGFKPAIINGREHAFHVIQVDLSLTDKELKAEFDLWLKSLDRGTTAVVEQRGRTSAKECLKFLSAYRLLKRLSPNEAIDHTGRLMQNRQDGLRPLYSKMNSWYNARDKAKAILTEEYLQIFPK